MPSHPEQSPSVASLHSSETGRWVQARRIKAGFSLCELAELAGQSAEWWAEIESGSRPLPRVEPLLKKLAKAFKIRRYSSAWKELWQIANGDAPRRYCPVCGTPVLWDYPEGEACKSCIAKPPVDPTPEEIAERCAKIRAGWDSSRMAKALGAPTKKVYDSDGRQYREIAEGNPVEVAEWIRDRHQAGRGYL